MVVDTGQPPQQHDVKTERCRRLNVENAARARNGWIPATMVRARLLHLAILRLLGAPLRLALRGRELRLGPGPLWPFLAAAGSLMRRQLPED